jgi:hypothetical protein
MNIKTDVLIIGGERRLSTSQGRCSEDDQEVTVPRGRSPMLENPAKVSGPSRLIGYASCFRDPATRQDLYPYRNGEQVSVKQSFYKFVLHVVPISHIPRRTGHGKQVAPPTLVSSG